MKVLILTAGILMAGAAMASEKYLCMDGLSAQYLIEIDSEKAEAKVDAAGANQGSLIGDISKVDQSNPGVKTFSFSENQNRYQISIGADGVSTIALKQGMTISDMHTIDCRKE